MALLRVRCAEQGHDSITQRANHGSVETPDCCAHRLDDRLQTFEGLLRAELADQLGGANDICEHDGGLLELASLRDSEGSPARPTISRVRRILGAALQASRPPTGATALTEAVVRRVLRAAGVATHCPD